MSDTRLRELLQKDLDDLPARRLYKRERQLQAPQGAAIHVGGEEDHYLCAQYYLRLANHPPAVQDGHEVLRPHSYGVFSMDGDVAKLPEIGDLAERYNAVVMVDDSHATGILGPNGRGSMEELGVLDRVDIITSTLGKALGGAAGGFTCARGEVVEFLRQRSRPYLFSNSLPPMIAMAACNAVELIADSRDLRARVHANARQLRAALEGAGFP